jgi:hypothetical protein
MTLGTVLDPTAKVTPRRDPAGPPLPDVSGRTVGFRHDIYWRSWDWVVEEWGGLIERDGGTAIFWEHSPPTGKETDDMLAELDAFLAKCDASVIGLANCGACTMRTIHDVLRSLDRDLPTVGVATAHFEDLSRALAKRSGRDDIRLHLLPFPLEGLPEDEVRRIARDHYPTLRELLGESR